MNIEEYLDELKGQIRDKHAKEFVGDEVRCHIEEQMEAYENSGIPHDEALAKAVNEMGDPVGVGVDLDRIHRPHMEWRFLLYVLFISVLNIVVQYVINRNMPIKTGIGIFENLSRVSIFCTVIGFVVMLVIYRLDYTILTGRSRIMGAAYLILLTVLSVFRGLTINGFTGWIIIGTLSMPVFALMVLFLPIFAGFCMSIEGKENRLS
ncbi:MAG: hypothetical protein IJ608_05030 [Lachnospiraceae bacterium]|nr:hypothetical protein [Lachnospiraceae bacterium]